MNYLEIALKEKDLLVKRLQALLRIKSVLDPTTITPEKPFGEGIDKALTYMLQLAEEDGFKVHRDGGYAGCIEYGDGEEAIGVLCHLDVVPEGNNWLNPPYQADIVDDKIIARGAMDDKGPTMAAYFALKMIKDLNIKLSKKIQIILGTDEETGWRGVKHYSENYPMPEVGFAPDADFPLIYGEKGSVSTFVRGTGTTDDVISVKGGERFNVVIDHVKAVTKSNHDNDFQKYLEANSLKGKCYLEAGNYAYEIMGVAAHAMEPHKGINAGTNMLRFLSSFSNHPVIKMGSFLHEDYNLIRLGSSHHHDEMGELTCNIGIIDINEESAKMSLDMRCPIGFCIEKYQKAMDKKMAEYGFTYEIIGSKQPHYVSPDDELVQKLYASYVKYTGDKVNKPFTIGGGTYARILKRAVAFGMEMPGDVTVAHQPNEFIKINTLLKGVAIYAEALIALAK